MDANLVSCPKCGHTVNSTGWFCTYCGVAFLESESDPQADNQQPGGQPDMLQPEGSVQASATDTPGG
jgi:hypothetical protein